jgi:hypothetical protein
MTIWSRSLRNRSLSARTGERGSAYIIALLSLFLLLILGLSVSLFTQTEVIAGGQERLMERAFYSAEAGIDLSIGRALGDGDFGAITHVRSRSELEEGRLMTVRERVRSSPFFCLGDSPCNLCSINQGRSYIRRNHVLAINAVRFAGEDGGVETELARKSLSTMVDVEPTEQQVGCLAELPESTADFVFDDF